MTSNPEQRRHPAEHKTNLRFSLANEEIGSMDYIVHHPNHNQRVIAYPTPESEKLHIRDELLAHGLIIGKLISEDDLDEFQTFAVPDSARPLAYEARSRSRGAFSYNDTQLFAELGDLFASATLATQGKAIDKSDLSHVVAIVEFTRPGERKVLFVPGVETLFHPIDESKSPLSRYSEQLTEQFGDRFTHAEAEFKARYQYVFNKGSETSWQS